MGWEYLLVLIVAAVLGAALRPKAPAPPPPTADDIQVPTAEEGRAIGVVFGDRWIKSPNVVWWGTPTIIPIRKKAGKK